MSSDSKPAGQWVTFLPSRQHKIVTVWWILVPNGDLWKIRGRCKVSGGQVEGKHCCTTKHRDAQRILHPHVCTHTHTYITHTSDGEISTSSSSLPFWTRAAVLVFIFSVTFFHCVLENDSAFSLSAAVVGDSVCVVWRGQRWANNFWFVGPVTRFFEIRHYRKKKFVGYYKKTQVAHS